ncbi:MAG TPA: tetratricopeptide repeat protein [Kofleriaceae bacterium]|nr:tetratricopeptide repeat protein [Kofleriaceae bacterium]
MFALERYAEAAVHYERAFELKSDAALLYNAAQAHRLAGNKPRALALYQSLLRMFGRELSNQAEIRNHIESLKQGIENDKSVSTRPPVTTRTVEVPPGPAPPPEVTPRVTPAPVVTVVSAPPPPAKKPLVKKGWFWAVVVGGAAVVATGVGLGIALGGSRVDPAATFGTARGN